MSDQWTKDERTTITVAGKEYQKKYIEEEHRKVKKAGPKAKVALNIGYIGTGYKGSQIQVEANGDFTKYKTVESDVWIALNRAGLVSISNLTASRMKFSRASRTDRGVHAVGNILSMHLRLAPDLVSRLNENLPETLRVFGYERVTNAFNARNDCFGRTYEYLLPTFVLDTSEDASSEKAYSSEELDGMQKSFNDIAKTMVGSSSRNFHNYGTNTDPQADQSQRILREFVIIDSMTYFDISFVRIRLIGQSFMYHQIRKLIAAVIQVSRKTYTLKDIERSFTTERLRLSVSPGEGLLLSGLDFKTYEKKKGHIHQSDLTFNKNAEEMEDFKKTVIFPHIAEAEKHDKVWTNWMASMNSYKWFCDGDEYEKSKREET